MRIDMLSERHDRLYTRGLDCACKGMYKEKFLHYNVAISGFIAFTVPPP